jgi:aspartyl-tRNA(Asn)/glutamyl-tRNA(Gln) amidotransferase subunit C
MSLDKATIRRIANLARIEVPEADLGTVADQLSGIMGWIEQLAEVNTDNVAPMSGGTDNAAGLKFDLRKDVVSDGDIVDKVVANAPDAQDNFFTVPKVVE